MWQVVCTKVREGDKRIVRLKEGHVSGHHVVIVDDLVQSGGTLVECQVNILFTNTKGEKMVILSKENCLLEAILTCDYFLFLIINLSYANLN